MTVSTPCNYVTVTLWRFTGAKSPAPYTVPAESFCASRSFDSQPAAAGVRRPVCRLGSSGEVNTGPMTTNSPILERLLVAP